MSVSETGEMSVTGIEELSVSKTDEMSLTGREEVSVSGTGEMSVSGRKEIAVSKTDEMSLTGREEVSVSGTGEMSVSGRKKMSVSKTDEMSLTGREELTVSGSKDISVSKTAEMSVTGRKNMSVTGIEELSVSKTDEMSLTGRGEVSVSGTGEMSVSGRKEISVSRKTEDSEELFCQPCSDDGHQLAAAGFCVDCYEYLCDLCLVIHPKARAYRQHSLLDKTKAQMKTPANSLQQLNDGNKIKRYDFESGKHEQDMVKLKVLENMFLFNEPEDNKSTTIKEPNDRASKATQTEQNTMESTTTQTEEYNGSESTITSIQVAKEKNAETTAMYSNPFEMEEEDEHSEDSQVRSVALFTAINVQSNFEKSHCHITGSVLLPDNKLIIVDSANDKVKLVDTKQNKVAAELLFEKEPWDVTCIGKNQVAVTVPNDNSIQLLSVKSSLLKIFFYLSKYSEIKVKGKCRGIASNNEIMIVTFVDPGEVQIINMSGTVLKQLTTDSDGILLFTKPEYVCFSLDRKVIYVTDYQKDTVTCLTLTGTVVAVYKDEKLRGPLGLAIDQTGTVYVCGWYSENIHQMTAECTKMQILLDHKLYVPYSIACCDKENKLYVGGSGDDDSIEVYQMK